MKNNIFGATAIVLDAVDNYARLVVLSRGNESEHWTPYKYQLAEGEHLLPDAPLPPDGLCKKHWTGSGWEEGASDDEVAAWNAARPEEDGKISPLDLMVSELTQAMADMQMQHDLALAELSIALMGGGAANV